MWTGSTPPPPSPPPPPPSSPHAAATRRTVAASAISRSHLFTWTTPSVPAEPPLDAPTRRGSPCLPSEEPPLHDPGDAHRSRRNHRDEEHRSEELAHVERARRVADDQAEVLRSEEEVGQDRPLD